MQRLKVRSAELVPALSWIMLLLQQQTRVLPRLSEVKVDLEFVGRARLMQDMHRCLSLG